MKRIAHHSPPSWLGMSAVDAATEAARQRAYDPAYLYRYLALFAPGVADAPHRYRSRLLLETTARGWMSCPGEPIKAIATSLVQGATGERHGGTTGCAVRVHGDDLTQTVRLDVDRGYPQALVDALAERYGDQALLVTRSRTHGRFHIVMRLQRPLSVQTASERLKHLIQGLVRADELVEAFPAPNRGLRMPFGLFGCEAADDNAAISRTTHHHPWELLRRAEALKPIRLPKAPLRKRRQARSERQKRRSFAAADRMMRDGIESGERDKGERTIIMAMHARGVPQREAVSRMRRLVYSGLIDRTRFVHECHGDVERARDRRAADMGRRVGDYYGKYLQALPKPVHLSPHDIVELTEFTRQRSEATGIPARDLRVFMYRVLSAFKGAALAGLPTLQWHHTHWQAAASHSQYGYNDLRKAAGVFTSDGSYLALKRAWRPDDAHAMRWHCAWKFDAAVPRRPLHAGRRVLTRHVNLAVGAARRHLAQGYQVQAWVSQPPPKPKAERVATVKRGRGAAREIQMSGSSVCNQLALSPSIVGISTKPQAGLGSVLLASGGLAQGAASTREAVLLDPNDSHAPGKSGPTIQPIESPLPKSFSFSAQRLENATRSQLFEWLSVGLGGESENRILGEIARRAKLKRGERVRSDVASVPIEDG